jgi:predicted ATPase
MIEKVVFRSFKALRNVEMELKRLTAIVGPNASGKTNRPGGRHFNAVLTSADKDPSVD